MGCDPDVSPCYCFGGARLDRVAGNRHAEAVVGVGGKKAGH